MNLGVIKEFLSKFKYFAKKTRILNRSISCQCYIGYRNGTGSVLGFCRIGISQIPETSTSQILLYEVNLLISLSDGSGNLRDWGQTSETLYSKSSMK